MLWPRKATLESYAAVLRDPEILSSMKVTILRTVIGVPLSVLCMAMLAYPLSKEILLAEGVGQHLHAQHGQGDSDHGPQDRYFHG